MLRGSGINVFPSPDSNRYVSIQNKVREKYIRVDVSSFGFVLCMSTTDLGSIRTCDLLVVIYYVKCCANDWVVL